MREEQPQSAGDNRRPRWVRPAWIVYWALYWTLILVATPVLIFVPTLGALRVLPGVTLRDSVGAAVYTLGGAGILRFAAIPLYWNAWHMLPPSWWRWAIVGGLLAAIAGFAGAGAVALLHAQIGDALGFPLYVSGICIAFAGIAVFAAGNVGMIQASRRYQRQAREGGH